MIKRILSIILVLCMILSPVVNVDALENGNIEEAKDVQRADTNDELKQDAKNVSRESSESTDITAEPTVLADEAPTSGTCGPNATWRLEDDTLIISGTGEMYDKNNFYLFFPGWYALRRKIKNVNIESGITTIGAWSFGYCDNLTSITIPDSVTQIGSYAFYNCDNLTSITIPDSVTGIGSFVFYDCGSLTSITIPNNIKYIPSHAFCNCRNLINIAIPDSVTHIYDYAFFECSSLKTIIIPDNVTYIGDSVFSRCDSLTTITIPNSTTSIGDYAFSRCRSLTTIAIPNSVTRIKDSVFRECKSLVTISIPNSVTDIGRKVFQDCSSLTNITIPDSITFIGGDAFDGCISLSGVYYTGNEASWQKINITSGNSDILHATLYLNSEAPDYDPLKYKIYTAKDVSPPDGYEGFDCSLEACMRKTDATFYNPQLAHMLIAMCNAVYEPTNMSKTLQEFGFPTSTTSYTVTGGIILAYSIAKKQVRNRTLVLVVARGTDGAPWEDPIEWASNVHAITNDKKQHTGFADAANALYDKITKDDFLGTTDLSNVDFVITGFSRGAAAANILAARLADEIAPNNTPENIYAYTFACPDTNVESGHPYNFIYNIANVNDLVSWIPQILLGSNWGKYGNSYWYSDEDWSDTKIKVGMEAHNQKKYLSYLRSEKEISNYAIRNTTESKLYESATKRLEEFLSNVGNKFLGYVGIHCPVDVEIFTSDGALVGNIKNGMVNNIDSDKIYVSIVGSQKDIYLLDNDTYIFNITAIGDGTMEYIVQNIRTSDRTVVDSKIFANVNLATGKQMISSVQPKDNSSEDTSIQTSEVQLLVLDENGDTKAEVIADGNGTEIPVVDEIENPDNPDPGNTNTNTPGNNTNNSGTSNPNPVNPGNSNSQTNTITKVEKITISGISHKIANGKKIALEATVSPSNATNKSITWSSSNTKYATVNSKGAVTIKKAGAGKTVTITATANDGSGKKATYKIKCMKGVVKKVAISGQKNLSLKVGKSINLKTKITASKGANKTLQWTSSSKKYVTVTNKGRVTAKKASKGKNVKITAMATDGSGKKAIVKIKIQ